MAQGQQYFSYRYSSSQTKGSFDPSEFLVELASFLILLCEYSKCWEFPIPQVAWFEYKNPNLTGLLLVRTETDRLKHGGFGYGIFLNIYCNYRICGHGYDPWTLLVFCDWALLNAHGIFDVAIYS